MHPVRSIQHIAETRSLKILRNKLPENWLVRGLDERDYGIDLLIEVSRSNRMTGETIVVQVKGVDSYSFKNDTRVFKRLKPSTCRYLLDQPAPSYLFVVSLADERVYWNSLREHDRSRADGQLLNHIVLSRHHDLSDAGKAALELSHLKERAWPRVEQAILGGLMFVNALGPLYLALKRLPPKDPVPSSVQQIIISHFENNALIQRYVSRKVAKQHRSLPTFYERAVATGSLTERMTFTADFALRFYGEYLAEYLQALKVCDRIARFEQRSYWLERHPYAIAHLDGFPPYFVEEDWYARYWFDEYENETRHVHLGLFFDVDDQTRHAFRSFMNRTPSQPGSALERE